MNFDRADLEKLLQRHSPMLALDRSIFSWIPEGEDLAWYLGFYECDEIHKAIQELFPEEVQTQAYEALSNRIRVILDELVRQAILSEQEEEAE